MRTLLSLGNASRRASADQICEIIQDHLISRLLSTRRAPTTPRLLLSSLYLPHRTTRRRSQPPNCTLHSLPNVAHHVGVHRIVGDAAPAAARSHIRRYPQCTRHPGALHPDNAPQGRRSLGTADQDPRCEPWRTSCMHLLHTLALIRPGAFVGNRHSCVPYRTRTRYAHRCHLLLRGQAVRTPSEGKLVRFLWSRCLSRPLTSILSLLQSDEAYQVGKGLTPVGAYLAQDDIIRIALEHGVDMIHPGYGLSSVRD